jgi:3-oxoacyl-[acyl-carrier-protein] synthase II
MSKRRVVVTGLGIVSPVGNTLATAGTASATAVPASADHPFRRDAYTARSPAKCATSTAKTWSVAKDAKKMDTFIHYGLAASMMAIEDRRTGDHRSQRRARGRAGRSRHRRRAWHRGRPRSRCTKAARARFRRSTCPARSSTWCRAICASCKGFKGPNFSAVSACATSNHSIGMAMRMIQYGDADIMVAAAPSTAARRRRWPASARMKACPRATTNRPRASRPWDRDRDGFVLGDGAGILCSRNTNRPRRAARASTASWSASAPVRRVPHDRAERERRRPGALHGDGDARRRPESRTRSNTSTRTAPRRRSATSPRRRR